MKTGVELSGANCPDTYVITTVVQNADAKSAIEAGTSMPTLSDYLGVSQIQTESSTLPYKSQVSQKNQNKAHKVHVYADVRAHCKKIKECKVYVCPLICDIICITLQNNFPT